MVVVSNSELGKLIMFDLIKIVLSFILTGIVGVLVSYYFQKKNYRNQLAYKQAEQKATELRETVRKLDKLSTERRFHGKQLIAALNVNKDIPPEDALRANYRNAVSEWNKNLHLLYLELSSQGLEEVNLKIENRIHASFCKAHKEIRKAVENKVDNKFDYEKAEQAMDLVFKHTRDMTVALNEVAENRWKQIQYTGSVELNSSNLERASTWILLLAIFHPAPHRLRIPSPDGDGL